MQTLSPRRGRCSVMRPRGALVLAQEAAIDPVLQPEGGAAVPVETAAHGKPGAIAEIEDPEIAPLRHEAPRCAALERGQQIVEQHRRLTDRIDPDTRQRVSV